MPPATVRRVTVIMTMVRVEQLSDGDTGRLAEMVTLMMAGPGDHGDDTSDNDDQYEDDWSL